MKATAAILIMFLVGCGASQSPSPKTPQSFPEDRTVYVEWKPCSVPIPDCWVAETPTVVTYPKDSE